MASRKIVPLPPSASQLQKQPHISRECAMRSTRFAEVAGGTAAECVAVACCCPCTIMNVLVVTVVRVPAGLCRRALRRKRHIRRIGMLRPMHYDDDNDFPLHTVPEGAWPDKSPTLEVSEMEKEIWSNFYGNGFWRCPSEREE